MRANRPGWSGVITNTSSYLAAFAGPARTLRTARCGRWRRAIRLPGHFVRVEALEIALVNDVPELALLTSWSAR